MAIQNADKTNFKELISEDFVIADFYGTTCVPCKLFSKHILSGAPHYLHSLRPAAKVPLLSLFYPTAPAHSSG